MRKLKIIEHISLDGVIQAQSSRRERSLCSRIVAKARGRMKCRTPSRHTAHGEGGSCHSCGGIGATGATAVAPRQGTQQFHGYRSRNHAREGCRRKVPVDAQVNGLIGRHEAGAP